jgi:hypothetical protein
VSNLTDKTIAKVKNPDIRQLLEVGNNCGREMHLIYIDSSIYRLAIYISGLEEQVAAKTSA